MIIGTLHNKIGLNKRAQSSIPLIILGVIFLFQGVVFAQQGNSLNPHGEFSIDISCQACHSSEGWKPAKSDIEFDHNLQTSFPLLGSHEALICATCHEDNNFNEPLLLGGDSCTSCHEDIHMGEFTATCESCHNEWSFHYVDGTFIHNQTQFMLVGAHAIVDCQSCHTPDMGLVFSPPPSSQDDCYSCHATDYAEEHSGSGFPTTCTDCHNTSTWEDAEFDHASFSGGFELLGAHSSANCQSCHTLDMGLVFSPPPSSQDDCYSCHATDYAEEHSGSGFPTTCTDCHNTSTWEDAEFLDHDNLYFPIFSGEHRGEWGNNCQTCHVVPSNFSIFSCIDCHEHNRTEMDDEHDDVNGYIYDSDYCYSCHPSGGGEHGSDD